MIRKKKTNQANLGNAKGRLHGRDGEQGAAREQSINPDTLSQNCRSTAVTFFSAPHHADASISSRNKSPSIDHTKPRVSLMPVFALRIPSELTRIHNIGRQFWQLYFVQPCLFNAYRKVQLKSPRQGTCRRWRSYCAVGLAWK